MQVKVASKDESRKLGEFFASRVQKGDVLLLNGELGAGKTYLSKVILHKLGISEDEVTSPTYSLIHEYRRNEGSIFHGDFYRLKDVEELENIGFFEILDSGKSVFILEWASDFIDQEVYPFLSVTISRGIEEEDRIYQLSSVDKNWKRRLEEWKKELYLQ